MFVGPPTPAAGSDADLSQYCYSVSLVTQFNASFYID